MKSFYEQFKTPIVIISLIFIALFLYTTIAGPIPFSVNSVQTTKTDLFSADGQGEESAVPDTASVSLGVTANDTSVSLAQDKVNQATQKIITAIKNLGIEEKDIKTTNYSVNPEYGNRPRIPTIQTGVKDSSLGSQALIAPAEPIDTGSDRQIVGYTVTQNIEIKIKPIDKVNQVIDTATSNGANMVGGINFTFSDELEKSLEQKARTEAVKAAKEKAKDLANISGIRLRKIANVTESSSIPRFYPMAAQALKMDSSQGAETQITPGENTVTINVTIFYETY